MTFEEQLTRAFETLAERLRGEIGQEVERRTAEAIAALPADRPPQDAADVPLQDATRVPLQDATGVPPQDAAARERLADGFQAIDEARSLTAILDTLLTFARAEAGSADLWLIRGGGLHRWRGSGSDGAGNAAPPRQPDAGVPLTIAGTTVAVLLAEPGGQNSELGGQNSELGTVHSELGTVNDEPRTSNVALLARYASRSLEAITAFTTARALTEPPDAAGGASADEDAGAEDITSARRYARLLVSEIKLYHESAVTDGRRDRDLVARLGGEITRARVMYEQRVPPHVRGRADYFHDELVRTLANGDASLLEVRS